MRYYSSDTAEAMGVNLGDVNALLDGRATANVGSALGLQSGNVQNFIDGKADFAAASAFRFPNSKAATDLVAQVGRDGAIGFVLGFLAARAGSAV